MNNQFNRLKFEQNKQTWLKMYTMSLMQNTIFLLHLSVILEKELQKQQMMKKIKKFKKRVHQHRKRLANKKRHQQNCELAVSYLHEHGLFSTQKSNFACNMNYTF